MKGNNFLIIILAVLFHMTSCVEEIVEDIPITIDTLPSQEIIQTSFYGQLKDTAGNAVSGAEITLLNGFEGAVKQLTDESGNFQFLDEKIKGYYGNLKVEAVGMWDINKEVFLLKDKTSRVDIICQVKSITKTFSSSEDTKISLENDVEINFKAGSIGAKEGKEYDGNVTIYARSIAKGQDSFDEMSPGSGWGLDNNNEISRVLPVVTLEVDLVDDNGNQLQLKSGKSAMVKMKLPSGVKDNELDASVMHFNESIFGWDQNKNYSMENEFIEVEIPHFSTWSWCQIIALRTTVKGRIDPTLSGNSFDALHYVTLVYEPISFQVPTATDGYFYMPFAMATLPFTMIVENECEDVVYTGNYPALDVDSEFDFGSIAVESDNLTYSTLSVNVKNCDDTWIENGYATLSFDGLSYKRKEIIPIVNGSFEYSFLNCESELTGSLTMLDEDNLLTTDPIEINLNNGDVQLGNVMLCDTFDSFMEIIVDGNQTLRGHTVQWGCTTNGNGEQITGVQDIAIFQTREYWSGPGDYTVNFGSFIDSTNDLLYRINDQVVFTITDYSPNENDPTNECARPAVLIGTMIGTAEEYDNATSTFIKNVSISGSFEYL